MNTSELLPRWVALLAACGVPTAAQPHFGALLRAYSEPHRAYHNLTHIAHVLGELDAVAVNDAAALWAAWYHDVVYQPGAADNEARSAALAENALASMNVAAPIRHRVSDLILATKDHGAHAADSVAALFLDADLAILGAPADTYDAYAAAIRAEHAHIPAMLYRRGRRRFLEATLARERIFQSAEFSATYEKAARRNLARELERL